MAARQRIVRVRRDYNQWVANQTLEDFALRFTAKSARRWSALRVANTALGAISFLALEAIGGTITLSYGFTNAMAAIVAVSILIFATGLPISYYAAKYGVDIDLLTRGAGFGYIGSTITSLIYASFTFIFFAIEAVIMSTALERCFGLPLPLGYVLSSIVVIPLVTHGITFISRFQLWTQPVWLVLHALPFAFIAGTSLQPFAEWTQFTGVLGDADAPFSLILFGTAASVVLSLIAQIGEQVDFLRFLPEQTERNRSVWWLALLSAGPGWIVPGALKLGAGSFLAFLACQNGVALSEAAQPIEMYFTAFQYMISSPSVALLLTGIFVIVSQLKINVTNAYAGSIAWSNFFSRLTHRHPGRVVWLVFNIAIALTLMELGVYRALEQILALYSAVAAAWVGALVADLVINKPLKLSPAHIEFKRAHLYDINPVGVGAMLIATAAAILAFSGALGGTVRAFTPMIAMLVAFTAAPVIAVATKGRYYTARRARRGWSGTAMVRCSLCENSFEGEDSAYCPAYSGPICSLCCSLDSRCRDSCKVHGRVASQLVGVLEAVLPRRLIAHLDNVFVRYLGLLLLLGSVIGGSLAVMYLHTRSGFSLPDATMQAAFWKIFFVLLIIVGVAAWLFILTQESRRVAEDESRRQTTLLLQEIRAHKKTDAALQKAKEVAEAANHAKSRYVVGISHELRTPLNAVLGYAQLLDRDGSIPPHRSNAIRIIRRSGEHLAGLIDGLLDISKIEAGRLHLNRDEVYLGEFLDQIVDMFRLQAAAKGVAFEFTRSASLADYVHIDKKRLRQILINLLSNAIKFTVEGKVALRVTRRSQVTEIEVEDTGVGIDAGDLARIFEPFERVQALHGPAAPGMGLGLTITKLLTEIMGGEISVTSRPGAGSLFRVRLLLSEVAYPSLPGPIASPVRGYVGRRQIVLVADDDPVHREIVRELLEPLGFGLVEAANGPDCLQQVLDARPDLVLLDIAMPGMNGWQVARALRDGPHRETPIVMVSANAAETSPLGEAPGLRDAPDLCDAHIVKPMDLHRVLETIGDLLKLDWLREDAAQPAIAPAILVSGLEKVPPEHHIAELRRLGRIGHVRGIQAKLGAIIGESPEYEIFVNRLGAFVSEFEIAQYLAALDALDDVA